MRGNPGVSRQAAAEGHLIIQEGGDYWERGEEPALNDLNLHFLLSDSLLDNDRRHLESITYQSRYGLNEFFFPLSKYGLVFNYFRLMLPNLFYKPFFWNQQATCKFISMLFKPV